MIEGIVGDVPSNELALIAELVEGQKTLEDVVRWGLSQQPARMVSGIVIQDEYTHDVIMAWDDRLYLVYDTT